MNSVKVEREDIWRYNWQFSSRTPGPSPPSSSSSSLPLRKQTRVNHFDVVNFSRTSAKVRRNCVLCGRFEESYDSTIPKQNKGVCRTCDSAYWLMLKYGVIVKFCKGCKLFFPLIDFDGKPSTTKCGNCRRRVRNNYHQKVSCRKFLLNAQESAVSFDNNSQDFGGSDSETTSEEGGFYSGERELEARHSVDVDKRHLFSGERELEAHHSVDVDKRHLADNIAATALLDIGGKGVVKSEVTQAFVPSTYSNNHEGDFAQNGEASVPRITSFPGWYSMSHY